MNIQPVGFLRRREPSPSKSLNNLRPPSAENSESLAFPVLFSGKPKGSKNKKPSQTFPNAAILSKSLAAKGKSSKEPTREAKMGDGEPGALKLFLKQMGQIPKLPRGITPFKTKQVYEGYNELAKLLVKGIQARVSHYSTTLTSPSEGLQAKVAALQTTVEALNDKLTDAFINNEESKPVAIEKLHDTTARLVRYIQEQKIEVNLGKDFSALIHAVIPMPKVPQAEATPVAPAKEAAATPTSEQTPASDAPVLRKKDFVKETRTIMKRLDTAVKQHKEDTTFAALLTQFKTEYARVTATRASHITDINHRIPDLLMAVDEIEAQIHAQTPQKGGKAPDPRTAPRPMAPRVEVGLLKVADFASHGDEQFLNLFEKEDRDNVKAIARATLEAKRELCGSNLALVVNIAKKRQGQGLTLLDMVNEGTIGMLSGIDRFDHKLGFAFSTYISWWVKQAINRAITQKADTITQTANAKKDRKTLSEAEGRIMVRNQRPATPEEIAAETGFKPEKIRVITASGLPTLSLDVQGRNPHGIEGSTAASQLVDDETLAPDEGQMTGEASEEGQRKAIVAEILDAARLPNDGVLRPRWKQALYLTDNEYTVLRLRFGLDRELGELTLEEARPHIGVTKERIRQIESKGLAKLKAFIQTNREVQESLAAIGYQL